MGELGIFSCSCETHYKSKGLCMVLLKSGDLVDNPIVHLVALFVGGEMLS